MNSLKKSLNQIGLMTVSLVLMSVASQHCCAQGGYNNVRNVYDSSAGTHQTDAGLDPEKASVFEVREMAKKLKLSEEQLAKVERIITTYAIKRVDLYNEMKKLMPPLPDDLRARLHDKIMAVKTGKDRELRAVLTDEQYQIYLKR